MSLLFNVFVSLFSMTDSFHSRFQVQGAIDSGVPTQLSYGFISGFCSGYALKKVGKAAATVLGTSFFLLAFFKIFCSHLTLPVIRTQVLDSWLCKRFPTKATLMWIM